MSDNQIIETQDGSHSIRSGKFGVAYHSRYGAVQESRHVFIEAGLYPSMLERDALQILEVGFGTGLNALLTLVESVQRGFPVRYTALEAYPISLEEAGQLNFPDLIDGNEGLGETFLELHRRPWGAWQELRPGFHFRKLGLRLETWGADLSYDLIYFDPFAPETQPELWETEILSSMYQALRPGGVLVTYCAKGVVKRRLKSLGFRVEALPGPPGKREMTRALRPANKR